ncbi:MAG: phenylacetate-CoA oxygenase subunit PaaJ [Chitinophagia bacterium]|nr:phenylacetate-CoA oxygenase subunit PaaJ [Chitinophagia bacterium]
MLTKEAVWRLLGDVKDPEVPALSILDLGIVRDVQVEGTEVTVKITPTYSGCPAMDVISIGIRMALMGQGFSKVNVAQQLSPAWTTDWMTETGKEKLKAYGIAPPQRKSSQHLGLFEEEPTDCPRCGSNDTALVSRYGPTSCKALYKCNSCKEPFELFKCH